MTEVWIEAKLLVNEKKFLEDCIINEIQGGGFVKVITLEVTSQRPVEESKR